MKILPFHHISLWYNLYIVRQNVEKRCFKEFADSLDMTTHLLYSIPLVLTREVILLLIPVCGKNSDIKNWQQTQFD
jgi:hypothetical protein